MPQTFAGWESSVNPVYTDFGEVEPSALHPTTQKELCNKGQVLIYLGWLTYKVMALARLGGGGGSVQFRSL